MSFHDEGLTPAAKRLLGVTACAFRVSIDSHLQGRLPSFGTARPKRGRG
jgi:hypothetical protein